MEYLALLLDLVLHVDRYIDVFVRDHGAWVYALLFAIVFVETGLVVMPFLPGDSLLFMVGTLAGTGVLSLPLSLGLLLLAAVAGDQTNFTIGRVLGARVQHWPDSRWFNRRAYQQAHDFYAQYGPITIVLARFMPFVRTFAPFVAGVADMSRSRFVLYNLVGAVLWVGGIGLAGYLLGHLSWVQAHLEKIIWGMVLVPGFIAMWGSWRASRKTPSV